MRKPLTVEFDTSGLLAFTGPRNVIALFGDVRELFVNFQTRDEGRYK
jgi:hypothetical protein